MFIPEDKGHEFDLLADPLIKWLNDNTNPHCKIIVSTTHAELVSGELVYSTSRHIKD